MDFFRGRTVSIVTKHRKEQVIGPILEKIPGLRWQHVKEVDTDVLGTFTGEIARAGTQREACLKKIELCTHHSSTDLVLANEGAFGPHPSIPFAQADIELLMLYDTLGKKYWEVWEVSSETNAFAQSFTNPSEALDSAIKHGFPGHGMVIVCKQNQETIVIRKGIHDMDELLHAAEEALALQKGKAYVEADLRAMHNPGRMKVIEKAAQKLVAKLLSACPSCSFPGFAAEEVETGLPCEWCGGETEGIKNYIYNCQSCGYMEKKPGEKTSMEAMYCPFCNP